MAELVLRRQNRQPQELRAGLTHQGKPELRGATWQFALLTRVFSPGIQIEEAADFLRSCSSKPPRTTRDVCQALSIYAHRKDQSQSSKE